MPSDKEINFGWFVRTKRERLSLTLEELAAKMMETIPKFSSRRLSDIERRMREPAVYPSTFRALGAALGFATPEDFDSAWKSTVVARPDFKASDEGADSTEGAVARVERRELALSLIEKFGSMEAAKAELKRAWNDPTVRKAAHKPKKS